MGDEQDFPEISPEDAASAEAPEADAHPHFEETS